MATEKQIAANRANALRSTGPKTLAGKSKSSGNAYRHGLSQPLERDMGTRSKVAVIAHAFAGNSASDQQWLTATLVAEAQVDLMRIRKRRAELLEAIELGGIQELRRLAALDYYERLAMTRRRKAAQSVARPSEFCKNEPK